MASLIRTVVERHGEALSVGAMLTVARGRVRRHTLPVARPALGMTADSFRAALQRAFDDATRAGQVSLRIEAGHLHRIVGGYPGRDHRMPLCCHVMRSSMAAGDTVVESPPSGAGASLTIEYRLPRPE